MILAYIDPGSGALVWQVAIAALMGFLFYLSKVRHWLGRGLKALFRQRGKSSDTTRTQDARKD